MNIRYEAGGILNKLFCEDNTKQCINKTRKSVNFGGWANLYNLLILNTFASQFLRLA